MARNVYRLLVTSTALISASACTLDSFGGPNDTMQFESAFSSAPAGMEAASSSYAADGEGAWGGPRRGRGPGGPGMGSFMGGGLGDDFTGNAGFGRGAHRGPFAAKIDDGCTVAGGDVTCTRNVHGLTATTIYTIRDANNGTQTRIDTATTNSVRTRTTVTGTTTRGRDGANVTATVNNVSDRTVTGLAQGATQRTVNGTSAGSESTTGTNRDGQQFTAVRVSHDTTAGLIVPVSTTTPTYPTAGKVVRRMKITTTMTGGTPTVRERREEITYTGSATAKVSITQDGTTKTCTMALPRGRPNCG
ncbi:hypothetical protein [Gemmatimonas sp.]|jgi:hypothetical protein|uniref:hypothetical protein n=1 Tax=Gemmatimonas sp. TaxID=1962908 RepID=UPI00391D2F23